MVSGHAVQPTPPTGDVYEIYVFRADGNNGEVVVSHAFPLLPGMVPDTDKIVVRDNLGNIVTGLALGATTALFPDMGSGHSPMCQPLQFRATLNDLEPKTYTLEVNGTTRDTGTDGTYVDQKFYHVNPLVPAFNHFAVFIPKDKDYWCGTQSGLVTVIPEANEVADGAKTYFRTATDISETLGGMRQTLRDSVDINRYEALGPNATYNHGHGMYVAAQRSATLEDTLLFYVDFLKTLYRSCGEDPYFRISADLTSLHNLCGNGADSTLPASADSGYWFGAPEQHTGMEMTWGVGYIASDWKQPWKNVALWCNWTWYGTTYAEVDNIYLPLGSSAGPKPMRYVASLVSARIMAYIIGATLYVPAGYAAGGRNNDVANWEDDFEFTIQAYIDNKYTEADDGAYIAELVGYHPESVDGPVEDPDPPGGFPTFQLLLQGMRWILYYQRVKNDSRVAGWIVRWADFFIGQMVDEGNRITMPYIQNSNPAGASRSEQYAIFGAQIISAAYAITGDPDYKTQALVCANRREIQYPSPISPSTKNWGQCFCGSQQSAKAFIDGVGIRALAGAHPTTIYTRTTYTS